MVICFLVGTDDVILPDQKTLRVHSCQNKMLVFYVSAKPLIHSNLSRHMYHTNIYTIVSYYINIICI